MTSSDVIAPPEPRTNRWTRIGTGSRIPGVDLARALAVIGMMGAHVSTVAEDVTWSDPSTWGAIVHGRSSVLFGVIAGVSLALMSGGMRRPDADRLPAVRLQLLGRGLIVFAIGLALEALGTNIAVILTVYGGIFIVSTLFIHWRRRTLAIVGGGLALGAPAALALISEHSYGGTGFSFVFGIYPLTAWIPFVMCGLIIGRSDLRKLRTAAVLIAAGALAAVVGYGADHLAKDGGLGSGIADAFAWHTVQTPSESNYEVSIVDDASVEWEDGSSGSTDYDSYEDLDYSAGAVTLRAIFDASPHAGATADIVGAAGFGVAVLGLCLLLARFARLALVPLLCLGSMPLTAYTAHVIWYFVLQQRSDSWGPESSNGLWLLMAVCICAGTLAWGLFFRRGPLEWLTAKVARSMTKGLPPSQ